MWILRTGQHWFFIVLAIQLVRQLVFLRYGLGADEAHYALYGMRLDWSYFDHPPLVGWVQALFYQVFGKHDFAFRLAPAFAALIFAWFVHRIFERARVCQGAIPSNLELCTHLATQLSFLPSALWVFCLPDTLLAPIALWVVDILQRLALNTHEPIRPESTSETKTHVEAEARDDVVSRPQTSFQEHIKLTSALPKHSPLAGLRHHFGVYIELGVALGLAGLAKYTAVLFLPGVLYFFVYLKLQWGTWKRLALITAPISAAAVSPVVFWNWQNNWISFKYQLGHVTPNVELNWSQFAKSLLTEIIAYSPFLTLPAMFLLFNLVKKLAAPLQLKTKIKNFAATQAAVGSKKTNDQFADTVTISNLDLQKHFATSGGSVNTGISKQSSFLLALPIVAIILPTFLFFRYSSLKEFPLPHWNLVPFLLMMTLPLFFFFSAPKENATRMALQAFRRGTVVTAILWMLLHLELLFRLVPWGKESNPYRDLLGWSETKQQVVQFIEANRESRDSFVIAVPNWTLGSRANYYLGELAPVYVIDERFDQFDLWEGRDPASISEVNWGEILKDRRVILIEKDGFRLDSKIRLQIESQIHEGFIGLGP
ncbi:MAG: hypothetical protein COT74_12515 [Bdellovibrionales bacterium CG10_big_fil_rev_8_21_14_0_10_45_34]|nr:MAG: hypothetical protein COT74_12515 [Bdellovibrionales bacterium CG10_big_fil_rev_8_21_14_0_10_45_34]